MYVIVPKRRQPTARSYSSLAIPIPSDTSRAPTPDLGPALNIGQVANLIGCSPWTVRQTLVPRGLPHFRPTAGGRLIFYQNQIIRWIEDRQQRIAAGNMRRRDQPIG